jgi:hypothetical protein
MEKHSIETWYALAEVDSKGTFNKLVKLLDINFSTAEIILSDNNNDYLQACKYLIEKHKNLLGEKQQNNYPVISQYDNKPEALNQTKLLSDFWYVIIGFFVNLVINFAISFVIYGISLELGLLLFVSYTFFLTYTSTIGRYSRSSFYGFMNLIILSAIPIINWSVVYYFGRGLHLLITKQKLPNPPTATSAGLILVSIVVGLFILLYTFDSFQSNTNNINSSSTQIAISPTRTSKPKTSTPSINCLLWSNVKPNMAGRELCVYGTVVDHRENWENELTNFYFGTREEFFLVSNYRWTENQEGKCLTATGVIQLNTYNVPYIKIENFNYCNN